MIVAWSSQHWQGVWGLRFLWQCLCNWWDLTGLLFLWNAQIVDSPHSTGIRPPCSISLICRLIPCFVLWSAFMRASAFSPSGPSAFRSFICERVTMNSSRLNSGAVAIRRLGSVGCWGSPWSSCLKWLDSPGILVVVVYRDLINLLINDHPADLSGLCSLQ